MAVQVQRLHNDGERAIFLALSNERRVGQAWVQNIVTARRTGNDVGTVAELMSLEIFDSPNVSALRRLFCAVLAYALELASNDDIEGLVIEPANPHVERLLRHIPEIVMLSEYPHYRLLRAQDFESIDRRICDRLKH
jgi:hypothetical protein